MKSTNSGGLWTASYGEIGATLKVLQDHGVTREHFDRLRAEPDYAKRVAEFMLCGGLEGAIYQKLARAIMGKNFFGVEEWSMLYGINFTKKQLREVGEFPWNEDVLNSPCPFVEGRSIRETHFAFLGLNTINGKPRSILEWQKIHPSSGQLRFWEYAPKAWYSDEKFANEITCGFRWYLILQEIIPDSTDKTHQEQLAILPAEYEAPLAVEEVTKTILYYRKNSVLLNPKQWGRCQDIVCDGLRIRVGNFGGNTIDIMTLPDEYHDCHHGLVASRKH